MKEPVRIAVRALLALAYGYAGWRHLVTPAPFLAITPPWVPRSELIVAAPAISATRKAAGWGLALYALCVWPANFHHALADIAIGGETLSWWYHGPRLAAQPLIIWWALWASGATDWPFGNNRRPRAGGDR